MNDGRLLAGNQPDIEVNITESGRLVADSARGALINCAFGMIVSPENALAAKLIDNGTIDLAPGNQRPCRSMSRSPPENQLLWSSCDRLHPADKCILRQMTMRIRIDEAVFAFQKIARRMLLMILSQRGVLTRDG